MGIIQSVELFNEQIYCVHRFNIPIVCSKLTHSFKPQNEPHFTVLY